MTHQKKYQFHFETESYMDKNDNRINIRSFCSRYPKVAKFFNLDYTPIDYVYKGQKVSSNKSATKGLKYIE